MTKVNTEKLSVAMLCIHSSPIGALGSENTGGMSVVVRETARELARQGHRVDIFTAAADPYRETIVPLFDHVRLIHLGGKSAGSIPKAAVYDQLPQYYQALEAFTSEDGRTYDLLHSHYWLSARLGLWAQKDWGVPHVITYHTLGRLKVDAGPHEVEPLRRMEWERRLARACQRLVVATEQEKETLVAQAQIAVSKVGVVPFGVNTATFDIREMAGARAQLGLDANAAILLFVGRFVAIKGLERLLTAVALIAEPVNVQLLLIGGDGDGAAATVRLRSMADRLGISDRVIFGGRVEHAELVTYYNAADLLVLPSYYESYGLVVLEALACGTPVVATPVGLVAAIVRDDQNGGIVQDQTAAGIAVELKKALRHCRAGKMPPADIRASVVKFAWPTVTRALSAQYRQAIQVNQTSLERTPHATEPS